MTSAPDHNMQIRRQLELSFGFEMRGAQNLERFSRNIWNAAGLRQPAQSEAFINVADDLRLPEECAERSAAVILDLIAKARTEITSGRTIMAVGTALDIGHATMKAAAIDAGWKAAFTANEAHKRRLKENSVQNAERKKRLTERRKSFFQNKANAIWSRHPYWSKNDVAREIRKPLRKVRGRSVATIADLIAKPGEDQ